MVISDNPINPTISSIDFAHWSRRSNFLNFEGCGSVQNVWGCIGEVYYALVDSCTVVPLLVRTSSTSSSYRGMIIQQAAFFT